jgi:hypothetical protein
MLIQRVIRAHILAAAAYYITAKRDLSVASPPVAGGEVWTAGGAAPTCRLMDKKGIDDVNAMIARSRELLTRTMEQIAKSRDTIARSKTLAGGGATKAPRGNHPRDERVNVTAAPVRSSEKTD